jgi:hypothetical protein
VDNISKDTSSTKISNRFYDSENQQKLYHKDLERGRTSCNTQFRLKLIIAARIMLLKNIAIEHGLINSTRGIIKEYIYNEEGIIISIIIDFE